MHTILNKTDKANELAASLDALETSCLALRNALLTRRSEFIWSALEEQEKALIRLERVRRELGIKEGASLDESIFPPESRSSLREKLARTRILQRLNHSLTRVFLDLIDKTLKSINQHSGRLPLTYGSDGSFGRATAPLFVHQAG